jgi:hypothetical protein
MPANALVALEPRKTPIQARSTVTVQAISEATIQVLLSHGAERLTTTRVAERAGVSVGTLYQYSSNKHRNGADVTAFSIHIGNHPMFFPELDILEFQSGSFRPSETASD